MRPVLVLPIALIACGDDAVGPSDAGTDAALGHDVGSVSDASSPDVMEGGGDVDRPGARVTTFTDSGPITAVSGQVISKLRFQTSGAAIVVPQGVHDVVIEDCDFASTGGEAAIDASTTGKLTISHDTFRGGHRGVRARFPAALTLRKSLFQGSWTGALSSAIEIDYATKATVADNWVRDADGFTADVISIYASSHVRLVGNWVNATIAWKDVAPWTMGDWSPGDPNAASPGGNNYVAGNYSNQTGGVPAGIFGSDAATLLEHNCFASGIQAYNYSGTFVGVTIRKNAYASAVTPDGTGILGEWSTNVVGSTPAEVPGGLGYLDENQVFVPTLTP